MCTSQHVCCPGYQQRLKWSTKHEVSFNHKSLNTRTPTSWSSSSAEIQPDINHRSPSDCASHQEVEQQAWPLATFASGIGDIELTFLKDWNWHGESVGDFVAEFAIVDYPEMTVEADLGLPEQDSETYTPWADESQWLNAFDTLDTFSNFGLDSYENLTPVASLVYIPPFNQSEETFLVETQDQEPISTTSSHASQEQGSQSVSQTAVPFYHTGVPQTLTHIPTFLIDYWFHTVCATWNSFDSAKNLNRSVALEAFPHSKGLACSLQSMAAAYLAEHLPHFRGIAITMTLAAVKAIKRGIEHGPLPSCPSTASPAIYVLHRYLSLLD